MWNKEKQEIRSKSMYGMVLLSFLMLLLFAYEGKKQERIGEKLEPMVLRFHILAESDEEQDQRLKLQVRDRLLEEIKGWLAGAEDKEEIIQTLSPHMAEIQQLAEETLRGQGCDLPVCAELTDCWFPVRQYGALMMPAGRYETLRIRIGSANGQNWWCMLYPSLCLVDETFEIQEEEAELLREVLTEDEFRAIWRDGRTKVRIRFWLWERIEHFVYRNSTNEELNSK